MRRAMRRDDGRFASLIVDVSMDDAAVSFRKCRSQSGAGRRPNPYIEADFLAIGRGETVALLGPSGSGKSTLLMAMAGLERPDSGSIKIETVALETMNEDALARFRGEKIGIVFQSFHLIPTMTALENVAVPLELAGHADAFDRAAAELAAVGLKERLKHYPAELSGGEQQRVALARALWRRIHRFSSPTSRPAISMTRRARASSS